MKRLGIIGGMGPEATSDLFLKIIKNTPAKKDQEHIPIVIDNFPQIPDRTAFLRGVGESPLPYLLESVRRLEKCNVDYLCMPCNTAHYFLDELKKATEIPFVSIVESTLESLVKANKSYKKIGLMATDGTFIGRIYHRVFEKEGVNIVNFKASIQQMVMESIYTLKCGNKEEAVKIFRKAFSMIIDEEYDCLIAGCTEIPILLPYIEKSSIDIYDATELLALKAVELCYRG
ncbi:aspartate/glutamate racemase family protein [Deferribacteraceae bacterium V6Fe1]|nr:aspartate/glutamate racemase family protein [Deferribacteraceae bacterium V6Fe1]